MITLMNMQGIYDYMDFYKEYNYIVNDCTNIEGTNCYCDDIAREELQQIIMEDSNIIRYSDSGNYHYLTAIYLTKIKEPFSLVVFDHHTDMQETAFFSILSCGGWVLDVLDNNEYLKEVLIVGVNDELVENVDEKYKDKVTFIKKSELEEKIDKVKNYKANYPLYISIDKDVLKEECVNTNWDQGDLDIVNLLECLHALKTNNKLVGVDVCGEIKFDGGNIEYDIINKSNECNRRILQCFL